MPIAKSIQYPLPGFLEGICTVSVYDKWLDNKADTLLKRDKKRRKPYALNATTSVYKGKIHKAIMDDGRCDPFTGDALDWKLIATWDTSSTHGNDGGYRKKFALMPTVDHIDPDLLEFEICSWMVNDCKSYLNPAEFVALCKSIANYRKTSAYIKKWLQMKKPHT